MHADAGQATVDVLLGRALLCGRVKNASLQSFRSISGVLFTTAFDGQPVFERFLVEVSEDMRSVHEDGKSAYQRDDGVDIEQQTIKHQRDILPVINHLHTGTTPHMKSHSNYYQSDSQVLYSTGHQCFIQALLLPAPVAQWAKPLLIGHSACWPDGLRTLADLGTNPGLEGGFSSRLD